MKQFAAVLVVLVCMLSLAACGRTMEDIIENEPSITGTVLSVSENAMLIDCDGEEYSVCLDPENRDSYLSPKPGDEVTVYYDGNVAESYPMQICKVYAITLLTPADRQK